MSIANDDLLISFEQGNFGKFQEALEVFQADPNGFVKAQGKTTFEIILSTPDSGKFIQLCIKNRADFYMKSNNNTHYPLHYVIESKSLENLRAVESLFRRCVNESTILYSPDVNVKLNGQNSLHILIDYLNDENHETIFEMIKILAKYGCNVNYPDSSGKTPFYAIVEILPQLKNRREILDFFLKKTSVDFHTHYGDELIEMVMNIRKHFEAPEKVDYDIDFETMKKLLTDLNLNIFEMLFPLFKSTCNDTSEMSECYAIFLEIAIHKSLINIVDMLIDYGVDVNIIPKQSSSKLPALFLACKMENPDILRLFLLHPHIKLTYECEGKTKTILHQIFDVFQTYASVRRSDRKEMTENERKCFLLLMQHEKADKGIINALDQNGLPAIYYSVRYKIDFVTIELLKKGAYIGTVVNSIRRSLLEEFLNYCITKNNRYSDEKELEITIDYNFLMPSKKDAVSKRRFRRLREKDTSVPISQKTDEEFNGLIQAAEEKYSEEIKPLQKIAENIELKHFLAHPVIASFILLKWNKLSFLVYINLILIFMFMITFIPFMLMCQGMAKDEKEESVLYQFLHIASFVTLAPILIRELMQAILSFAKYIFSPSNWIDVALIASSLTILLAESLIPAHYSRILRTVIILLAAGEYFNILGMVPILSVSIHTKMYKRVCMTFLKSLAFYSVMLIGFGLAFYSLQGDKFAKDLIKLAEYGKDNSTNDIPVTNSTRNERFNNFYTVGLSIVKSFVMLTGELETSYIQIEGVFYAALFLIFLFLVTIVLYNLLNALAVSDTQEIKADAKLIDLNQRIVTMYETEEAIFKRNSRLGDWLKMVISMFPKTLPDGKILIRPNESYKVYVNQTESIVLNDWIPSRLKLLRPKVKFSPEIVRDIQSLLIKRREEGIIFNARRLKESRNEKLANDIIKMNELISDIQANVTKLQSDIYQLRKRANL